MTLEVCPVPATQLPCGELELSTQDGEQVPIIVHGQIVSIGANPVVLAGVMRSAPCLTGLSRLPSRSRLFFFRLNISTCRPRENPFTFSAIRRHTQLNGMVKVPGL